MPHRTLPYKEGSVFLGPLREGGFGRGVIARAGKRGHLLGYFFGPKLFDNSPMLEGLSPDLAIRRARFGDLGLLKAAWPVIGSIEPWVQDQWPIPEFLWSDPLHHLPEQVVVYTDARFDRGTMLGK